MKQEVATVEMEIIYYLTDVLKIVADPNRMMILALLQHRSMCVCELVAILQLSQPAVSVTLRKLKSYGLVKESKVKNWVYYSLKIDDKPYISDILQHVPSVKPLLDDLENKGLRVTCE